MILKDKAGLLKVFNGDASEQLTPFNEERLFNQRKWESVNFPRSLYIKYIQANNGYGYLNHAPGICQAIARVYHSRKDVENFGGFASTKDGGLITEYNLGNKVESDKNTPKIVVYEDKNGMIYANKYSVGEAGAAEQVKLRLKVSGTGEDASFWFFHVLCKILINPATAGEVEQTIMEKYEELERNIGKIPSLDDNGLLILERDLVDLENDIYAYCLLREKNSDIPANFPTFDEKSVKPSTIVGSPVFIKEKAEAPKKKATSKNLSLKKLVKEGTFSIGSDTNTTDRYDDVVPSQHVLQICKMLKVNNLGLLPKKIAQNFFFSGPAGTGKSTASYLIARLLNLNYYSITGSEDMTYNDIVLNILPDSNTPGKFNYVESPFVKAFRDGGVIEFQEVNCVRKPSVLTALNCALDDSESLTLPTGEIVKRHPHTIVIFTANVDYAGTRPMNQALLSRCLNKFEFELPADNELTKRLTKEAGVDGEVADKMVKVMHSIQKVMFDNGIEDGVCGYRELLAWAKDTAILGTPYDCAINTVVNGATLDAEARELILQAVQTQFTKNDVCSSLWDTI